MKKILLVLIIFIFFFKNSYSQFITVGPSLHCYFTKDKPKIYLGIEPSIWFLFVGFDLGIELEIKNLEKFSFYWELQAGYPVGPGYTLFVPGLSLGKFWLFENFKTISKGFQMTVWGCYPSLMPFVATGNFRLRFGDNNYRSFGIGSFGKLVIPTISKISM